MVIRRVRAARRGCGRDGDRGHARDRARARAYDHGSDDGDARGPWRAAYHPWPGR